MSNLTCPKCKDGIIIVLETTIIDGEKFVKCLCCNPGCDETFYVTATEMLIIEAECAEYEAIEMGYMEMS